jgi:UDP-N-acetylmuramate--alanine ligase
MNGESDENTIVVAEADEFDRSFLRLFPTTAVITSADADHLDIYGDHPSMLVSFKDFINQVNKDGRLIIHESIESLANGNSIARDTYGTDRGQFFAEDINISHGREGFFSFNLDGKRKIENITLGVPGFHNMENAIAATIVAMNYGASDEQIREALASFRGVKRRFEFIINKPDLVFIDDYAHHPKEIEAFLKSLRAMYPGKRITVVFQPHLYTRTRDFADGFATSLSLADELILMDIYPARELPIAGVTSEMIFKNVSSRAKIMSSKQELLLNIKELKPEVIATVGAGDIDAFVKPIKEMLDKK